ncbi:hypothetical protein, partial [Nocardia cyriacigeorgica]|uniref:hypothetical protein n=1 Tax=Nocardia cyriacigeorgica TaxID=135487 RepID=UPI002456087B
MRQPIQLLAPLPVDMDWISPFSRAWTPPRAVPPGAQHPRRTAHGDAGIGLGYRIDPRPQHDLPARGTHLI